MNNYSTTPTNGQVAGHRLPVRPPVNTNHNDKRPPTTKDYMTALAGLGFSFRLNELDDAIEVCNPRLHTWERWRRITDIVDATVYNAMCDRGFVNKTRVEAVVKQVAGENTYHPIRAKLNSLTWDGEDHIALLASHLKPNGKAGPTVIRYEDGTVRTTPHAFLRRWVVAAVGVAMADSEDRHKVQPFTLVLEGAQGQGKSTLVANLCSPFGPEFFCSDELNSDRDDDETKRKQATKFIWELGELKATTTRRDVNSLKNKLTQTHVTFRVPYARHPVTKPVLACFIGTVNDDGDGFLRDTTGNRRFAIAPLESLDRSYGATVNIEQVWAQALHLYRNGESWQFSPEEATVQNTINEFYHVKRGLDEMMNDLFVLDLRRTDDDWKMSPSLIGETLRDAGYNPSIAVCQKDAARWLTQKGHVKMGRPKTWRGIRLFTCRDAN